MSTAKKTDGLKTFDIDHQDASVDIWDKKYRLKDYDAKPVDVTIDDTFKRVAKALSDVEEKDKKDQHYEEFLWALRSGAIPAGRIMSNAGSMEYKPATSTINCTVSGSIQDSMSGILDKVTEAGLTLRPVVELAMNFLHFDQKALMSLEPVLLHQALYHLWIFMIKHASPFRLQAEEGELKWQLLISVIPM